MPSTNALFIITDQQRPDSIGHLGHDHAVTPNLDRLARRGACLTNRYGSAETGEIRARLLDRLLQWRVN